MQAADMRPTVADEWIWRAFNNDCAFSPEEFLRLSLALRKNIFQIANMYLCKELVQKLRGLRGYELPVTPEGPAILSHNMDMLSVEEALRTFLGNLRREGLLLTYEEFSHKDRALYFYKTDDIGRILGRDYIEKTARRLNLPYIKVPKKTAVIDPEDAAGHYLTRDRVPSSHLLEFTVSPSGNMGISCPGLEIYAEKITPIERKATREEMMGLLTLLEETGYSDFFGHNLFMGKNQAGEEGIYFVDTEYTNFSSLPCYQAIGRLAALMAGEDHSWLQQELQRRADLFEQQKDARMQALREKRELRSASYREHGFGIFQRKPFAIPIAELVVPEMREEAAASE